MLLKFQGKNLDLKFTYLSIHYIEVAFDKAYMQFLAEQTPMNQNLYLFWSMLQNDKEYRGITVEQTAELVEASLNAYDFTLTEYLDTVNKVYQDSIIVKQLFETENTPENPRRGGVGKVSAAGRKILYGIMRRLRNTCQRLLDKLA